VVHSSDILNLRRICLGNFAVIVNLGIEVARSCPMRVIKRANIPIKIASINPSNLVVKLLKCIY
jgi:hypothetical protein